MVSWASEYLVVDKSDLPFVMCWVSQNYLSRLLFILEEFIDYKGCIILVKQLPEMQELVGMQRSKPYLIKSLLV